MPAEGERARPLDEQLCFALYAASRAMTGAYRPLLDELGLTYPQFLVMLVLWEHGDLPVTGIGHALALETGTLSPLLKRLEAAGLITRTRQKGDERTVVVGLAPAGRLLERRAAFVRVAEYELTRLQRIAGTRSWLFSGTFDNRLREPVAVTKVIVSIVERRRRLQVER